MFCPCAVQVSLEVDTVFHVSTGPRYLLPLTLCDSAPAALGTVEDTPSHVTISAAGLDFSEGVAVSAPCRRCFGGVGARTRIGHAVSPRVLCMLRRWRWAATRHHSQGLSRPWP